MIAKLFRATLRFYLFCLQGVFIFSLVTYSPLEYNGYKYPDWGETIGWIMALSSIVCIPIVMIYKLATTPGSLREVTTTSVFANF